MPDEFSLMVKKIRQLEESLGTGEKIPHPNEESERIWARRALYAAKSLPKGTKLCRDHLKIVRPANPDAIGAPDLEKALGKVINKNIQEDEIIRWNDLES